MFRSIHSLHIPILALVLCFGLQQLKFVFNGVEAKHYVEPFGDIVEEEEEDRNYYTNRYEPRDSKNHHRPSDTQRYPNSFQQPFDQRYQNVIEQQQQQQPNVHRRGEREKYHHQNTENFPYAANNRNMVRQHIGQNRWPTSENILGEQQIANQTMNYSSESNDHKCKIWVPLGIFKSQKKHFDKIKYKKLKGLTNTEALRATDDRFNEALDKYPDAEQFQTNQITQSQYIETCCSGYGSMRWLGKTLCRPLCNNCQNGRCVAPGKCECYDEFIANDNGDCVFTCPMGCLNGRCYLDGTCQCDPGYKLDKSRKYCRPICRKGCGMSTRHNCTEPEVCGCKKGYLLTDTGCEPNCDPECGVGGTCRDINVCDCKSGYTLKDGVCQSDCYQKCDNGICYSRNRCICNPGYTYHERTTQCIPI